MSLGSGDSSVPVVGHITNNNSFQHKPDHPNIDDEYSRDNHTATTIESMGNTGTATRTTGSNTADYYSAPAFVSHPLTTMAIGE